MDEKPIEDKSILLERIFPFTLAEYKVRVWLDDNDEAIKILTDFIKENYSGYFPNIRELILIISKLEGISAVEVTRDGIGYCSFLKWP